MLGLAAVRATRNRKLLIAPSERIESATGEKRHDLKWLGGGAPIGRHAGIASFGEEHVAVRHHRSMNAVVGLHRVSAGDNDIELVASHYILKIPRSILLCTVSGHVVRPRGLC